MGEFSDQTASDCELFGRRWFAPVVAVFLRSVRQPALAYDLATETLAAGRLQWELAPPGEEAVARDAADELARMAAPIHLLRELRLSGLVEADPLPDSERERYGS